MPTEILSQPITQNLTATEASPPAPLRMERGVITEIPLYVLQMFSGPSPISSRPKGVTSHTTPLSIRRGVGGEASVSSVREKTPQRFFCVSSHNVGASYFSQIYTEEQNTQHSTETLSQPITQSVTANVSLSSTSNTQHPTPFFSYNVL